MVLEVQGGEKRRATPGGSVWYLLCYNTNVPCASDVGSYDALPNSDSRDKSERTDGGKSASHESSEGGFFSCMRRKRRMMRRKKKKKKKRRKRRKRYLPL
jgi:hypothetical protein